jgi:hypothetical protein
MKSSNELLNDLLTWAKSGPLMHAYVVEALAKYSDQVLEDESDWGNSFISKEAWQRCAQEVKGALDKNFQQ